MSNNKKDFCLKIENVGPHNNIKFNKGVNALKIAFFAKNGSGKTFISRALRLNEKPESKSSNELLSFGEKRGLFKFSYDNQYYEVNIIKDNKLKIENNTNFLFHVFNSDFISENLEVHDYNLDGNITGYIIGKSSIDLSNVKNKLGFLNEKYVILCKNIEKTLKDYKLDLAKKFNISKNLKEYKKMSFSNLDEDYFDSNDIDEINSKKIKLENDFNKICSMPDDLNNVGLIDKFKEFNQLDEINNLLSNKYLTSNLNEKLLKYCKDNDNFVRMGLNLFDKSLCPFCRQKINSDSNVIKNYDKYIHDEESKVIQHINNYKEKIQEFKQNIETYYSNFNTFKLFFDSVKEYIPNFNENIGICDKNSLLKDIGNLELLLNKKSLDISKTFCKESNDIIENINLFIKELNVCISKNNELINEINIRKNKLDNDKKQIQRDLCKISFIQFHFNEKESILKYIDLNKNILTLKVKIKDLESKNKKNKKEEVISSFKYFLNFFFYGKYTFDEKNFSIKFGDSISSNISNILSDGEKSVVAFCYYLALSHLIIDNEKDYQKLFFIIDDPISSMDYNYVYSILQTIKNIKNHFHISRELKYIILTHNLNFMNMLIRNNVTKHNFYIKNGNIEQFKTNLLLPYENHLNDIIYVFKNQNPSHTTPNSIRQILEHILYFEQKYSKLIDFVNNDDILNKSSEIYYLVNDLSHGTNDNLLPENEILGACHTLLKYINKYYPGQLKGKGVEV